MAAVFETDGIFSQNNPVRMRHRICCSSRAHVAHVALALVEEALSSSVTVALRFIPVVCRVVSCVNKN